MQFVLGEGHAHWAARAAAGRCDPCGPLAARDKIAGRLLNGGLGCAWQRSDAVVGELARIDGKVFEQLRVVPRLAVRTSCLGPEPSSLHVVAGGHVKRGAAAWLCRTA